MIEYFTAPDNIAFLIALTLFFLLFLVELLSLVFGIEALSFMDDIVPDIDMDVDLETASPGFLDSVFSFLRIGRVPMSMTMTVFLFVFSFIGFNLQYVLEGSGIGRLHWLPATAIAFVAALPFVRIGNTILEKVLPKDETSAISSETFVGRVAEITLGVATHAKQTEAKLVGPDGKTHYIQVVADRESSTFQRGDHVLVVGRRSESLFTIIEIQNPLLEK